MINDQKTRLGNIGSRRSRLLEKADQYAYHVYRLTSVFPNREMFGITAQLRRAALSVPLNIIEGFARQNRVEFRRFLQISYASLQESLYLLDFSLREKYLRVEQSSDAKGLGDEVGKMLWVAIRTLTAKSSL